MDVISKNTEGAIVRLSADELYMLALAVATVCDGMAVAESEFATVMGWEKAVYERLGDQVAAARRVTGAAT